AGRHAGYDFMGGNVALELQTKTDRMIGRATEARLSRPKEAAVESLVHRIMRSANDLRRQHGPSFDRGHLLAKDRMRLRLRHCSSVMLFVVLAITGCRTREDAARKAG